MVQVFMVIYDRLFYVKTLRWIIAYQLVWLGFVPIYLQIRPALRFFCRLSETMIETFILDIFSHRPKVECSLPDENKPPSSDDSGHVKRWSYFPDKHRELETRISDMWRELGMAPLIPGFPFMVMASLHFFSDDKWDLAIIMFSFLGVLSGYVVYITLYPMANVSSMFGSAVAFRGKWDPFKGRMSIAAVVRRFGQEDPHNKVGDPEDLKSYHVFLDYVQGFRFAIMLNIPILGRVPVTKSFVATLITDLLVKFPALVGFLLVIRSRYQGTTDGLHTNQTST
jgi:hypothetical protein